MSVTQLADVIVPAEFTSFVTQNIMEKTALFRSGAATPNAVIARQLKAGSDSFSVPFWNDLGNDEANIANDDPDITSTPKKINAAKQLVRKCFLHQSWSAMNLASELAGDNALTRIQDRTTAYWDRQLQRRLISSMRGIMADNIANDGGDLVHSTVASANMAEAVIDAAGTLGDRMSDLTAIAFHSDIYKLCLKRDMIETMQDSQGRNFQTFRGLAVIVDDGLSEEEDDYTSILFGPGAIGYGVAEPNVAAGTELENLPSAGNGGGQQVLHSRINLAIHPAGFAWKEATVAAESPTIAELAAPENWDRVVERKAVPLAFLRTGLFEA